MHKLTELDIANLKKIELEMLKEFIEICKTNGLRYFLVGGSALGAVRHKGFIPWDDDIDIAMPRKDYDFFIKIAKNYLPQHIFVQTYETDPHLLLDYCKLRNSNTTFIEHTCEKRKINHGIFIDIFPIDGYPSSEKEQVKLERYKKTRKRYLSCHYRYDSFLKNFLAFVYRIIFEIFHMTFNSKKVLFQLEKYYKRYDYETSELCVPHGGVWGKKEITPRDYYGKGVVAVFENIEVIIPEKYDLYLEQKYHNYMELPPLEKRQSHHYCEVFDSKNSYQKYLD